LTRQFTFRPVWLRNAVNAVAVGTIHSEEKHPISRMLFRVYGPAAHWVLRHTRLVIVLALIVVLITIPIYFRLGHEFMPPLNEGVILYMPTTLPGISATAAAALLQRQDQLLKQIPEVERVFGKAGRADTWTDPATLSMMETTDVIISELKYRQTQGWFVLEV